MEGPIRVWLDCDTGHDDAFASLLAARHPSLDLLGISTVYGNAPLEHTTRNTRAILKAIGREDVPVHPGASKPFCRGATFAPSIHGASGLDGTTCLPTPTSSWKPDVTAVDAMYRAIVQSPPESVWLVATGCLTNIALLFAVHPETAELIAGLSIMGGAIGGGFTDAPMGTVTGEGERFGNHTACAEFNICLDPESAKAIFDNSVLQPKTTLITLDLTHQFLATERIRKAMLYGWGTAASSTRTDLGTGQVSPVRKLFHEILVFFAKTYADVFGLTEGPPTHDPLAVAAIFRPDLFEDNKGERYRVDVVTDGVPLPEGDGSSICGRTIATLLPKDEAGVRIPRGLEKEALWRILEECLERAEAEVSGRR